MNDPYLAMIDEHWDNIVMVYDMFKDKKPIIEYDIDDHKIYSYPASDYINTLSSRTRADTQTLYQETIRTNTFLLFVKDTKNRRLRSYVFPLPEDVSEHSQPTGDSSRTKSRNTKRLKRKRRRK